MIFCFGELLLRMSPALGREWIQQRQMPVYIGGAELNVATALANWQVPVRYMTALPDHYLSREILDELREKNIDTSTTHFSGNRVGLYYLPQGTDLKSAGVIYDRAHSSFSELKPGMIDWDAALDGCTWFHFSAISPALNEQVALVCQEGLEAARKKGMTISVDLNYRAKLWQYGKQPPGVMLRLLDYCQVVMGNIWAAEQLLGFSSSIADSKGKSKEELVEAAGKSMLQIHHTFPGVMTMAYTFRLDETYFAVLQHGPVMVASREFSLEDIKDRAGSGDCFMAGLIYGLHNNHAHGEIIDFAAAAAVGKMQEAGDASNQDIDTVKNIMTREWTATK